AVGEAHALRLAPGAAALHRPVHGVEAGVVDHAQHALVLLDQPDRHAEAGVAAHEVVGAVDGVDDPGGGALVDLGEALLAQQPEAGEPRAQALGDAALALHVDLGDDVAGDRLDAHVERLGAGVVP